MKQKMRNSVRWTVRKLPVLLLTAVVLLASAGIALGITKRVRATNDNRWRPRHTYITRGDYVRWRNPTNRFHDVRATNRGKNWSYHKNLPPGTSVRRKFRGTGDFHYRCTVHSGMTGWVHVSA